MIRRHPRSTPTVTLFPFTTLFRSKKLAFRLPAAPHDHHRTLRRMLSRRRFIAASTSAVALAALGLPPSVLAADGLKLAKAQPFSHDAFIAQARALADRPYIAPPVLSRAALARID